MRRVCLTSTLNIAEPITPQVTCGLATAQCLMTYRRSPASICDMECQLGSECSLKSLGTGLKRSLGYTRTFVEDIKINQEVPIVRRFTGRDSTTYVGANDPDRSDVVYAERSRADGGSYESGAARSRLRRHGWRHLTAQCLLPLGRQTRATKCVYLLGVKLFANVPASGTRT
jgi:hypothetical protein